MIWFWYVKFEIKANIEKLIGFLWKYNEINVSQYIAIQWKIIAIYRNMFFLYRDTPNKYNTLFIAIIIAETQPNFSLSFDQFQHIAFMFTESDINRTRKSEVNKQFTDWIKEYSKQNEKSYICIQSCTLLCN